MPLNVSDFLAPLAITAVAYGAGPLLLRLRKGPVQPKALKWFHIGYTVVLALAFAAYNSLNGYRVNLYPAFLWGSIFYWWNRNYFEKRNYPPVQPATTVQAAPASPDPVPSEPELPAVIPEKKVKRNSPRTLSIVLAVALALSLAGNVWQSLAWNAEKKEFDSELKGKDQEISNLKSANISLKSEISDLDTYRADTYYTTGYIVSGSDYYHRYDCPVFKEANTYQSHNTKFCEWLGYSACPVCKSGFLINFNSKMPQQSAP